jgi:hypothetical protein
MKLRKMKRNLFVILVLVVFLVGSIGIYGMPKKGEEGKGSSTADTSKETIELNDDFRARIEVIPNLVSKDKCSATKIIGCWRVSERKLCYFDDDGDKISGSALDEVEGFWYKKSGVDEHGNLYDKDGNLYSDNGLVKILAGKIPKNLAGKITQVGGQTVVPLKDPETGEETFNVGGVELDKPVYDELRSNSGDKVLGVDINTDTISWKIDGKDYSISQSTDKLGIKTTFTIFDDDEETVWVLPDGSGKSYKSKDGWDFDESKKQLTNEDVTIKIEQTVKIRGDGSKDKTTIITETSEKTKEKTETKLKSDGTKEIITEKDGTLVEYSGTIIDGRDNKLSFEATEIDDKGDIKETEYRHDGTNEIVAYGYYDKRGTEQVIYVSGDGEYASKIWEDDNKDGIVQSDELKSAISEDELDESTELGEMFGKAFDEKDVEIGRNTVLDILAGRNKIQQAIVSLLDLKPGWEALSAWWMPETTRAWNKLASETFDKALLAEYIVPAAVCDYDAKHKAKKPGESAVFIEVAPGIVQFVGSIQAEKTAGKTAILCSYEGDTCPKDYVCKEGLCYENKDAEKPIQGHFYKITWGVTAPTDESFTPYIDENGIAIKFNLKFTDANWWLYNDEGGRGSKNTIELKNGARDGGVIAHYSEEEFDEICILFGASSKDLGGNAVKDICVMITTSEVGKSEFEISKETSSTTTESGEVNLNNEW